MTILKSAIPALFNSVLNVRRYLQCTARDLFSFARPGIARFRQVSHEESVSFDQTNNNSYLYYVEREYIDFCLGIVKIIIVCEWNDLNVQLTSMTVGSIVADRGHGFDESSKQLSFRSYFGAHGSIQQFTCNFFISMIQWMSWFWTNGAEVRFSQESDGKAIHINDVHQGEISSPGSSNWC
jgi:hypothetical protein